MSSNSSTHGSGSSSQGCSDRVVGVHFDDGTLSVDLEDGRTITVPLSWYPRLDRATPEQRANWEIAAAGFGIHWPDIDEDLAVQGLLRGAIAPAPFD